MKIQLNRIDIERRIRKLSKLSTLPTVAFDVMRLLENPRASVSDLTKLISADQILTARILKHANSANYGFQQQICTLNLALVVVGFSALRDLILSITAIDLLNNISEDQNEKAVYFLHHGLLVGCGARFLAESTTYHVPGEAFVAGLLHDIGYQILIQEYLDQFNEVIHFANKVKVPLYEAERKLFGFDHAEIGAWLAEEWNLPKKLVNVIRYHHQPENAKLYKDLVKIIHVAELIGESLNNDMRIRNEYVEKENNITQKLKKLLQIDGYPLEYYQNKFRVESKKTNEFLYSTLSYEVNP